MWARHLWLADSRTIIGRMTADIRRLSADDSLIKCHRPTVRPSSADWRPMIVRLSADIMIEKNLQKVGRLSADQWATIARRFTDEKTPENRRIGQRNFWLGCFHRSKLRNHYYAYPLLALMTTLPVRVSWPGYETVFIFVLLSSRLRFSQMYYYTPVFRRDVLWYGDVRPSGSPSVRPSIRLSQFPDFSPTCFDILIKFVYRFIFMHVRSSSNAINLHYVLQELCWNSNSYKYAVFRTFLLATYFDILSSNLAFDFVLMYHISCVSVVTLLKFLLELCLFVNLEYTKYCIFSFN